MVKKIVTLKLLLISTLICVVGCVNTKTTILSNLTYPPITPENVTIYLNENDIPGQYEKVGIIHVQWDSNWFNEHDMYAAARKDAAKIGANGILVRNTQEPSVGERIVSHIVGTANKKSAELLAVHLKENENNLGK